MEMNFFETSLYDCSHYFSKELIEKLQELNSAKNQEKLKNANKENFLKDPKKLYGFI